MNELENPNQGYFSVFLSRKINRLKDFQDRLHGYSFWEGNIIFTMWYFILLATLNFELTWTLFSFHRGNILTLDLATSWINPFDA